MSTKDIRPGDIVRVVVPGCPDGWDVEPIERAPEQLAEWEKELLRPEFGNVAGRKVAATDTDMADLLTDIVEANPYAVWSLPDTGEPVHEATAARDEMLVWLARWRAALAQDADAEHALAQALSYEYREAEGLIRIWDELAPAAQNSWRAVARKVIADRAPQPEAEQTCEGGC